MNFIPVIAGEQGHQDIFSELVNHRIVMLTGDIDQNKAATINAQLLFLDSLSKEPIQLYINSPGGVVNDGLSIVDTMRSIEAPVYTIVNGMAASMGAVILACGDKRFANAHSRVMIHQPLGGIPGHTQASDFQIACKQMQSTRDTLNELLAEACGKSVEDIAKDTDRDFWMSAREARNYGIIDEIIEPKKGRRMHMKTVNVSAAAICRKAGEDMEILLCERNHGELTNCLEYVGGKIEPGETPEEAVVREVKEELLTNIKVEEKIGVIEHDYETFHLNMHLFLCTIVSGEITLTEHASSRWVKIADLNSSDLHYAPADKKATKLLRDKLGK